MNLVLDEEQEFCERDSLDHHRGAGSPCCLDQCAENSGKVPEPGSTSVAHAILLDDLPGCSDVIFAVSACLPGRYDSVTMDLDKRLLVCSLASGTASSDLCGTLSSVAHSVASHCTMLLKVKSCGR